MAESNPVLKFVVHNWIPIVLLAVTAAFIGQNRETARVHLLWMMLESPMWLLLSAILLIGIVVGVLLNRRRQR
ncbi:MAG: DUF1049 domain-containing protein [Mycobacteriaceae bacterium]